MTRSNSKLGSLSVHDSTPRSRPGEPKSKGTPLSLGAISPSVGTQKSVSLSDWWLASKNGVGIEGLESKSGCGVRRLFSSGTISKRLDSTTLETFDGILVSISGPINRLRTLHNGFSLKVCDTFRFGFPYNWKEEKQKQHFHIPFDDIPVDSLNNLLLVSSSCDVLDDVLDGLRDFAASPTTHKCHQDQTVVEGVKTRSMLKRRQHNEASIGERVHATSKKRNNRYKY